MAKAIRAIAVALSQPKPSSKIILAAMFLAGALTALILLPYFF